MTYDYSLSEIKTILSALKADNPWYFADKEFESLKKNIKISLMKKTKDRCCYCYRNIRGEYSMVIDIEHILPASIFTNCIFDIENLSVSCKKCNMKNKNNSIEFLDGDLFEFGNFLKNTKKENKKINKLKLPINLVNFKFKLYFKSNFYKIIHPNIDKYTEHLEYISNDYEGNRLVIYKCLSEKGRYTYDFFKLKEFEIGAFDKAQGIHTDSNDTILSQVNNLFEKN